MMAELRAGTSAVEKDMMRADLMGLLMAVYLVDE